MRLHIENKACLENEFARHFSIRGTQASHGEIFLGWSGGEIEEIQTRSLCAHFGRHIGIFLDALMTV